MANELEVKVLEIDVPSVIARLESGTHSVSVDTLSKVAHALGKQVELV